MNSEETPGSESGRTSTESEQARKQLLSEIALRDLVGTSAAFAKLLNEIKVAASVDALVLLTGETGTGKDICARAIHYAGPRVRKPFIPINCCAVPNQLFENEFFGHAPGAFTDARRAHLGLVREAEGGTIFLDDIEALSLSNQAKLLRFLEGNEYTPLGFGKPIRGDVRIIAASNEDLRNNVKEGRFREDVYFRLNLLSIHLPSLRDRVEDIVPLSNYFLERFCRTYNKPTVVLSENAIVKLERYSWPGNVRELENVLHRCIIHSSRSSLREEDLPIDEPQPGALSLQQLPFKQAKEAIVSRFERDYVTGLLRSCHGNISKAAAMAGKHRRAFWELMKKYDISRTGSTAPKSRM